MRRWVLLCAALLLLSGGAARADGDPASDFLVVRDVFLPYSQIDHPPADARKVSEAAREARAAGYPLKIALIESTYDLGTATALFERPQDYARFLGLEL